MTSDLNNPRGPAVPETSTRSAFLNERGSIALTTALILVVVLAMVALGAEISTLLLQHRRMQTAADQAAIAGAAALNTGSNYTIEADAISAAHGFTNGVNGVTVTVNRPPSTGSHAGDNNYVEVYVGQPQTFGISQLFHSGAFAARARGVASRYGGLNANFCMLALSPTAAQAIFLKQNVYMANPTCGLASNSSNAQAIYLSNNASVSGPVYTHGQVYLSNGASTTMTPLMNQAPLNDPYGGVTFPATGACQGAATGSGPSSVTNLNLSGGNCWQGWSFDNKATLNLTQSGVYYVRSTMFFGNNVTVNAQAAGGVTIVLDNNVAISFGNGMNLNITAPTSGPYAGLAMAARPTMTTGEKFPNNMNVNVVGAIYFPGAAVEFDNNLLTSASKCTQVIGATLSFQNNVGFNYQCAGTGVVPITASTAALEE